MSPMPGPRFQQTPDYLRMELGYGTVTEIAEIYRALAVACVHKRIARVLITVGDDDPAVERSLRDAVTTIVLAGMPDDFRLALVAALPRAALTYLLAERDLNAAGVRTRLFESEADALRWLGPGPVVFAGA